MSGFVQFQGHAAKGASFSMKSIAPLPETQEDESPPFTPLSAEQAQQLRERNPQLSAWRIVAGQLVVGLLAAVVAWVWTGQRSIGGSVAYGALAVAIPAALYARALARKTGGGAGWLMYELIKISLTVTLLVAAPRIVPGLNWLALLTGVILATKMYWVALAWWPRPKKKLGIE
jgi:ATP synthase protein I